MIKNSIDVYGHIRDRIKDQLVFDVGANRGRMTAKLSEFGSRVVAVEPNKNLIEKYPDNYQKSHKTINACVSNSVGQVTFYECSNRNNISTCSDKWKKEHPRKNRWLEYQVDAITLDSMIEDCGKPKYIKIDVEGYESVVLEGLNSPVDLISFEYTGGFNQNFQDCLGSLKRLGNYELILFHLSVITKPKKYKRIDRVHCEGYDDCLEFFNKLKKFKHQGDLLAILRD